MALSSQQEHLPPPLINAVEVKDLLLNVGPQSGGARDGDAGCRILDCTWFIPGTGKRGADVYAASHIPGALHFDLDEVADQTSKLPHMLPNTQGWERHMARLGVGNRTRVVLYDQVEMWAAPRVWWMFRCFGHERLHVLQGGLRAWTKEAGGEAVATQELQYEQGRQQEQQQHVPKSDGYRATFQPHLIKTLSDILMFLDRPSPKPFQLVDARPSARFSGAQPEPRPGLPQGHIPGSLNVPFTNLLSNGGYKSVEELHAEFDKAGVDLEAPIVTTCGSGVTAAVVALGLELAGKTKRAGQVGVYDGSWAEYGLAEGAKVATGD